MTTSETDWPDPIAQAIRDIHILGEELGFTKLRIDRSARLDGEQGKIKCYFEVGYGCREVKIRTYDGNAAPVGSLRFDVGHNTDKVDMEQVLNLLVALIDEAEDANV